MGEQKPPSDELPGAYGCPHVDLTLGQQTACAASVAMPEIVTVRVVTAFPFPLGVQVPRPKLQIVIILKGKGKGGRTKQDSGQQPVQQVQGYGDLC